jgi:prepilin-type processing-associated H-X9-DG protein
MLEQAELYAQIDLDESYASPQNAAAGRTSMAVYLCPSAENDVEGETHYGGITGERITSPANLYAGALLPNNSLRLRQFTDGASNTIQVAEETRGPNMTWIHGRNIFSQAWGINETGMPSWVFGENEIRSEHAPGAMALFVDGHVELFATDMELDLLAAMCTRNGGESVSRE